jgi:hypothetical protein
MSRHLHLTGLAVVITVFAGVMTPGEPEPERSPGIAYLRARLAGDLHARDTRGVSAPADPTRVSFDSSPSRVVPGLRFLEAREPARVAGEAPAYAVVGVRGSVSRVLHDPADMAWLAGSWRPATSREVVAFCTETIALATDARNPVTPPFVYGVGADTLPDAVMGREAIADAVVPPVVRPVRGDAWRATLWSIEAGRTRLYECRLGAGEDRLGIGLTVVDSLPGTGLAPRG